MPTLVICGDEDAVTPPAEMRAMADGIRGARFTVLAGAGHLSNLEQPAAFGRLLAGFLDEAYPSDRLRGR
jgi:pimeloyl-ACP methyl ester carboxylesterase